MMTRNTALCLLGLLGVSALAAADDSMAAYGEPLALQHVAGSQPATAMVSTGTHLYTAASGKLHVYSLEKPLQPRLVNEVKGFRGGRQLAWSGDLLFLTARDYGLWIFDISDRERPKLIRRYDTTELATGVHAGNGICLVAHRVYGTQLLDITDPNQPKHLSTIRTREAQTVVAAGKLVFLGDWGSGEVTIASIENPREPRILTKIKLDGFGDGLDVNGNLCLASTGHHSFKIKDREQAYGRGHGLEIIDITNPEKPVTRSVFKFPPFYLLGNDFWTVRSCGSYAFAVDTHNGFFMLDISNPDQPRCLGYARLPDMKHIDPASGKPKPLADCATSVALGDGCVYITGAKTGLFVLPAPGKATFRPPTPVTAALTPPKPPAPIPGLRLNPITQNGTQVRRACLYQDDIAFFACSHEGIKAGRLNLDGSLTILSTTPVRDAAYDVAVNGNQLFVAEGADGLAVYDIQPDASLKLATRYHQPGRREYCQILHLYDHGNRLAWHGRGGTLMLLQHQNGTFQPLGFTRRIGILYNDNLSDTDLDGIIACNFGHGSRFINLRAAAPGQPLPLLDGPVSNVRNDHNNNGYAVYKGRFIIPAGNRFLVYDPKTLETAEQPDVIPIEGSVFAKGQVTVHGDLLCVVQRSTGTIATFDLSQPGKAIPLPKRSWTDVHGIPDRALFWRGRLVIPAGPDGVYIETP